MRPKPKLRNYDPANQPIPVDFGPGQRGFFNVPGSYFAEGIAMLEAAQVVFRKRAPEVKAIGEAMGAEGWLWFVVADFCHYVMNPEVLVDGTRKGLPRRFLQIHSICPGFATSLQIAMWNAARKPTKTHRVMALLRTKSEVQSYGKPRPISQAFDKDIAETCDVTVAVAKKARQRLAKWDKLMWD